MKPSQFLISPHKKISWAGHSRSQRADSPETTAPTALLLVCGVVRATSDYICTNTHEFLRFMKHWQTGRRSKPGNIPVYWVHLSEHLKTSIVASEEGGLQGASCCSLTRKKIGAAFCQVEVFSAAGVHL